MGSALKTVKTNYVIISKSQRVLDQIKDWFDKIALVEPVSYCLSVDEGLRKVDARHPAVLVIKPLADGCPRLGEIVRYLRKQNACARIIALREPGSKPCAAIQDVDQVLAWPASFNSFVSSIQDETWNYAVARGGYRGHVNS